MWMVQKNKAGLYMLIIFADTNWYLWQGKARQEDTFTLSVVKKLSNNKIHIITTSIQINESGGE